MTAVPQLEHVYFELSNACNFRCEFCPLTSSRRPVHFMELALFRRGVDEIAERRPRPSVGFHILGEPLMSPIFVPAVRYARERGLRTEVVTNGSLLPQHLGRLIEAGPAKLTISLHSNDPEYHAARGTRIPFEEYYRGVVGSVGKLRAALPGTEILVCVMNTASRRFFSFDRSPAIDQQGRAFERRFAEMIRDLRRATGRSTGLAEVVHALRRVNLRSPRTVWLDERLAVQVLMLGDWGNAFTDGPVCPARFGYCGIALRRVGVLNDGAVTLCCADYDGQTALGNLGRDSLASLLDSEKAWAIRRGFRRLRVVDPYCRRCLGGRNRLHAMLKGLVSIYLFAICDPMHSPSVRLPLLQAAGEEL